MKIVIEIKDGVIQDLLYGHGTDGWMLEAAGDFRKEGLRCKFDREQDDEGTFKGRKTLHPSHVMRGLSIMAKEDPEGFALVMADNADRGAADSFYQCAIFGRLVYA